MDIHDLDEKITIAPFNAEWEAMYQKESQRIQKKLENPSIIIEHIGSTAIHHISAKPIIDIMIGIQDIKHPESVINKLIELGYAYFGEANVPGRLYFRRRGKANFNIALCQYKGEIWINNILFRDYLRAHPNEAKLYGKIKENAIESGIDTLLKYSETKQNFINKIIAKAKKD
jgi:GrpB-like predicted nucleotidyltransferase (UPF0157 family)